MRGGERQLLYLANWLAGQGHDNTVVCRAGTPLESGAKKRGLPVMTLPFAGEWDAYSALKLRQAAAAARRSGKIPVLHAHTAHAAGIASLAARAGGPTYVAHRRVDFRLSNRFAAQLKYGPASAVIAVSGFVAELLSKDGISHLKIRVVPDCLPRTDQEARLCGLDRPLGPASAQARAEFRERRGAELGFPAGARWIGNLAALVPHKDHETLLRAFASVRKRNQDARLIILGEGPHRAGLEALARSLGLAESVRFLGHVSDAHAWMQALDVYAHSSWGEGMGSVLLEALACEVPIAATTAGGIPETVSHEKTALLSAPRDSEALATNILRLLNEPATARTLADNGARRADDFSLARCGELTLSAYLLAAGFSGSAPRPVEAARA